MYYLETNSIRTLANKIIIKPNYLTNCFTSILSLCELLSGIIDDKSFIQRKGILRKIYFSRISADMDMPETKMFKAYGISFDSKINDIALLGALCIASKSFSGYLDVIQKYTLSKHWDFLKIYDDNGNNVFRESIIARCKVFDYSDKNLISDFKNRWDNIKDDKDLKEEILNELIVYHAESIMQMNSTADIKGKRINDVISSYDHSLDFYFLCSAYFLGSKIIFKDAPSKNDFFDLNHLMYLRCQTDIIISNDTMLLKLMNKFYPNNILPTKSFESIIEK